MLLLNKLGTSVTRTSTGEWTIYTSSTVGGTLYTTFDNGAIVGYGGSNLSTGINGYAEIPLNSLFKKFSNVYFTFNGKAKTTSSGETSSGYAYLSIPDKLELCRTTATISTCGGHSLSTLSSCYKFEKQGLNTILITKIRSLSDGYATEGSTANSIEDTQSLEVDFSSDTLRCGYATGSNYTTHSTYSMITNILTES